MGTPRGKFDVSGVKKSTPTATHTRLSANPPVCSLSAKRANRNRVGVIRVCPDACAPLPDSEQAPAHVDRRCALDPFRRVFRTKFPTARTPTPHSAPNDLPFQMPPPPPAFVPIAHKPYPMQQTQSPFGDPIGARLPTMAARLARDFDASAAAPGRSGARPRSAQAPAPFAAKLPRGHTAYPRLKFARTPCTLQSHSDTASRFVQSAPTPSLYPGAPTTRQTPPALDTNNRPAQAPPRLDTPRLPIPTVVASKARSPLLAGDAPISPPSKYQSRIANPPPANNIARANRAQSALGDATEDSLANTAPPPDSCPQRIRPCPVPALVSRPPLET